MNQTPAPRGVAHDHAHRRTRGGVNRAYASIENRTMAATRFALPRFGS